MSEEPMSRYVRQPKVGEVLEHGRYGIVRVVSVHDRGRKLVVLDHAEHQWTTERAEFGTWLRADEDACVKAHNGEHRFRPSGTLQGSSTPVACECGATGTQVQTLKITDLLTQWR